MTPIPKLKDLFIGYVDGETESKENNFELLFYRDNRKVDEIMQHNKFLITGRKGTGKTILAKYLENHYKTSRDYYCKISKLNDFKSQKFKDLDYNNLNSEELNLFWKWFFLIEICQIILSLNKVKRYIPFTPQKKIYKFISQKYSGDLFRLKGYTSQDTTTKSSNILSGINKGTLKSDFSHSFQKIMQLNKQYEPEKYYNLIDKLDGLVKDCLKNTSKNIILIYDDLDELDGNINENLLYRDLIISMLETAKDFNNNMHLPCGISVKLIIVLRDDIIDTLHPYSSNLNKLVTDVEVSLDWTRKNFSTPDQHPLIDLILSKIQKTNSYYGKLKKEEIFQKLFDHKYINNKNIVDYLLGYSFGRPRDIVRFLNLIKYSYPEATSFKPEYFKTCLLDYSKWFYNEMLNEVSIHEKKEFVEDSIKLITNFKKTRFTLDELDIFYIKNKSEYSYINNTKDVLVFLFKFGIIGNCWLKTVKGKACSRYSWVYWKSSNNKPNFSKTFVVHNGFRNIFGL